MGFFIAPKRKTVLLFHSGVGSIHIFYLNINKKFCIKNLSTEVLSACVLKVLKVKVINAEN